MTYSVITKRLHPDSMREFIHRELDRMGLPHSTFTEAARELIIRSADGILRKCRNLCLATMLEAVRASSGRTMDIDRRPKAEHEAEHETHVPLLAPMVGGCDRQVSLGQVSLES